MIQRLTRLFFSVALLMIAAWAADPALGAEPQVRILSPKDGSQITQDQNFIFVSGKVTKEENRSSNADIMLVIDISGSTAMYAGTDLGDANQLPDSAGSSGFPTPQISIGGMSIGRPPIRNLRNSVLAAEVAAARRLIQQLNSESTRVGVLTFGEGARLLQPLTHDFTQVRRALDDIMRSGPYGGTNMVEGIRLGITELMGLGVSERRTDAIKVQFLLTDGFPTLPIGGGKRAASEDTNLAINAARLAGKAGIRVHSFALGEEALTYPRAAVGIARESGGTYTPVTRPADVLAVVENISVVGVDYVQIVNQTTGQKASQLRLASDGFFSSAVPVAEGRNQIDVLARATDGANGRASITVFYQTGTQKSLDLEVFLEKERKLKLEVERLGRNPAEIQRDVERNREDSLKRPQQLPTTTEGPSR
ncbi:MAG TPA: VWA domain-containing protein [Candidatus Limnocylindria bacterium]|nr:VWA domain-containing protein [Candidatus Limnocylindria bacterium]